MSDSLFYFIAAGALMVLFLVSAISYFDIRTLLIVLAAFLWFALCAMYLKEPEKQKPEKIKRKIHAWETDEIANRVD